MYICDTCIYSYSYRLFANMRKLDIIRSQSSILNRQDENALNLNNNYRLVRVRKKFQSCRFDRKLHDGNDLNESRYNKHDAASYTFVKCNKISNRHASILYNIRSVIIQYMQLNGDRLIISSPHTVPTIVICDMHGQWLEVVGY